MTVEKLQQLTKELEEKNIKFRIIPFGFNAKLLVDENGVIYK